MSRIIIPLLILLALAGTAHAIGIGQLGVRFGGLGAMPKKGSGGGGGGTNFILMIDNTSRILQTDNASKICKAGGC